MEKSSSMPCLLTKALKNFYEQKGEARDFMLYTGHSKLTKTYVKLNNLSKIG